MTTYATIRRGVSQRFVKPCEAVSVAEISVIRFAGFPDHSWSEIRTFDNQLLSNRDANINSRNFNAKSELREVLRGLSRTRMSVRLTVDDFFDFS